MRVEELIKILATLNPNADVIVQKDAEGNAYSPLAGVEDEAIYVPNSSWSGDVYPTDWSADDAAMDEKEWNDIKTKQHRCIVLYPLN